MRRSRARPSTRLRELKAIYDPANVFNQNFPITPRLRRFATVEGCSRRPSRPSPPSRFDKHVVRSRAGSAAPSWIGRNRTLAELADFSIGKPLKIIAILVIAWLVNRIARRGVKARCGR